MPIAFAAKSLRAPAKRLRTHVATAHPLTLMRAYAIELHLRLSSADKGGEAALL